MPHNKYRCRVDAKQDGIVACRCGKPGVASETNKPKNGNLIIVPRNDMNCYHCNKITDDTFLADDSYLGLGVARTFDDTIAPMTVDYEYPMCQRCKEELISEVPPAWIVILEPIEFFE